MRNVFTYSFEELPLVIEGGFDAGLVNGSAEIAYTEDVWDFSIRSISQDGFKQRREWSIEEHMHSSITGKPLKTWEEKSLVLDAGHPLHSIIYSRLEHDWAHKVQDAIREELVKDREYAASERADQRRDELAGV
jgi:hypothetical protein